MFLTTLLAASIGQSATDEVRLIRYPDVYGDKVVFVYASDLWVYDRGGGLARRLTSHPNSETYPKFSPDGKWIAFTASYDGAPSIYVIPSEGGEPRRLTYEPMPSLMREWSPDGKTISYVSPYGDATGNRPRLWNVDFNGGMPQRTDLGECFDLSYSPDGKQAAFNRAASQNFNWRRYRGGTQGRLAFWDFATKSYTEVSSGKEQNYSPMWVGDKVFYVSDKTDSNLNLWVYDTKSRRTSQVTKFTDGDVRWPSTDGKTIVFERNLRLHSFDIATGAIKQLDPHVTGDNLAMRPKYVNVGGSLESMNLSPSGKRLAVVARGEVFTVPATRGVTRNVSSTQGGREKDAQWSADGSSLMFLGDSSGDWKIYKQAELTGSPTEIKTPAGHILSSFGASPDGTKIAYTTIDNSLYVLDPETGASAKVYTDIASEPIIEWSPDSNWLAYVQTQPNTFGAITLYDVKKAKSHRVNSGLFTDQSVSFDLSGKYLYFLSSRTYGPGMSQFELGLWQSGTQKVYMVPLSKDTKNPLEPRDDEEPTKAAGAPAQPAAGDEDMRVDVEGMEARTLTLPYPAGDYAGIVGLENGLIVVTPEESTIFSLATRRPAPLLNAPIQSLGFNADRSKMVYASSGIVGISDVQPGVEVGTGRVNFADVGMVIDPAKEYKQMFWDVWRYERDQFYDPNMLGLNWKAIGDKYAAMLPYIGNRTDLDYIFGQLIGELGTGHAYVSPKGLAGDPYTQVAGLLGADYVSEGGKVKFLKVYKGVAYDPATTGPLGALGVNVNDGDYLLAVNGEPVSAQTGVGPHLMGKVGKKVELTVNSSPSMDGARKVTVRPIIDESNIRYMQWVEERRLLVDKASGGRIGYIHVPDTSVDGMIMFVRGFYSQTDKEAWVIDERFNGGGWIPTFFIEALIREMTNVYSPRHGENVSLPTSLNGPKAMLINEYAGSGGDLFPYLFKKAGLGPLIGTRTWGGLVGINGYYGLSDGGGVTAPAFGIFDPKTGKWIAENTGVDPDILVDDRPDLVAQGKDVQLDTAIEYLMKRIPKERVPVKRPPFPTVGGG